MSIEDRADLVEEITGCPYCGSGSKQALRDLDACGSPAARAAR